MELEVQQQGAFVIEMWRGIVVIAGSVVIGSIFRIWLECTGRRKKRIDVEFPPAMILTYMIGMLYIIFDILRNFGEDSLNVYELPLASAVVVATAYFLGSSFHKGTGQR